MALPAGVLVLENNNRDGGPGGAGRYRGSPWMLQILPFMEQQNALDLVSYDFNIATAPFGSTKIVTLQYWNDVNDNGIMDGWEIKLPFSICPSTETRFYSTNYYAVQGGNTPDSVFPNLYTDGVMGIRRGRGMGEITDGTSNTTVIGESSYRHHAAECIIPNSDLSFVVVPTQPDYPLWYIDHSSGPSTSLKNAQSQPAHPSRIVLTTNSPMNDPRFLPGGSLYNNPGGAHFFPFSSEHTGGANFAFGDGHVSFVSDSVDQALYQEAASMNHGGIVDHSQF
jgi:prepilin-type processing-associated H-X9-DG protein